VTTLKNNIRSLAAISGSRFPAARFFSPRDPVILVYHGVPRQGPGVNGDIFERQLLFLKQKFDLVSWEQLGVRRSRLERVQVVLTFDDGFRNNAEVVAPILQRHRVPAIFFVSTHHAGAGKYLWFSYLRMLEASFPGNGFSFRGAFQDMSPARRANTIGDLRSSLVAMKPHPAAMYDAIEKELPRLEEFNSDEELNDRGAGMTPDQIASLARDPLFTIGAHTVDHPFLTNCESSEANLQIINSKQWLEQVSGQHCCLFAYPAGDYNLGVIEQCRAAGFTHGFTVDGEIAGIKEFELPRLGVYYASLNELGFKVRWGYLLQSLQRHGFVHPRWSVETQGRN
jgi:peptidoglycan/xylan/chitin deacetylase (PgdA/CDA1 family)